MHSYLIVIFNESVFDTPTYKTLIKMLSIHPHTATLFVWDNSPLSQHESGLESEITGLKINYYHSDRNENLSIVYNRVMKIAFDLKSDYITLLDQDSYISPDFKQSISDVNSDYLQVPKVCSDKTGKLISPRYQEYNYLLNKCSINYLDSSIAPGVFESKHMFAIGSGMTISKSLWFSGIRFQDRLSFYGVDTEFCVDYATKSDSFILLDSTIKHNASNEHDESYEKFKWRLIKYYEHWSYQLIRHVGLPLGLVSLYIGVSLKFVLLKNKIKRLFIINKV